VADVELPEEEAKDPFERSAGVIMGTLAVVLALISMFGDDASFDAQIAATNAANKWAHYQSKSVKEHVYATQRETLALLTNVDDAKRNALVEKYTAELTRYEKEKAELSKKAEDHEKETREAIQTANRYQLGQIQLEISLVLGSIALLTRWKTVWRLTITLGVTGIGTAVWAFVTA
jgi:hypothetical protein